MSDLIDRQAAIKAVERLPNCYNGFSDTYDKACIIGVLEELPSAQLAQDLHSACTDTISRQAAISAVNTALFPKIYTAKEAEKALRDVPSAQPEQRWIPVVEDLPKEEGYFFVTDEAAGMAETLIDKYIRCDDGEWVWLYSQHVVAWMPLPEPYRGGEQDGLSD